jgi:hypothetical protein
MNTIADELVSIQTGSRVCPLDALVVWRSCSDRRVSTALRRVLTKIGERVRGCRADCSRSRSRYEILGERRLPAFSQRLRPFAVPNVRLVRP